MWSSLEKQDKTWKNRSNIHYYQVRDTRLTLRWNCSLFYDRVRYYDVLVMFIIEILSPLDVVYMLSSFCGPLAVRSNAMYKIIGLTQIGSLTIGLNLCPSTLLYKYLNFYNNTQSHILHPINQ